MGRLGVVGGHSVLGIALADELGARAPVRNVAVAGGPVGVADAGTVVFLQRHGIDRYVPAHRIDHHAHARALAVLDCDRVLALSSVGALRAEHAVGTVVVPDDFVGLGSEPDSRFVDERGHAVPGFAAEWRARVIDSWRRHAPAAPVAGGVYWQVRGPRFETAAEVRFLAAFADVVGMTVARECVACSEEGLAYAAVCIVDNLGNGVGDRPLTIEEFEAGKEANRVVLVDTLRSVVPELAG